MKNSLIYTVLSWFSIVNLIAQRYQAPTLSDENYIHTKMYQKAGAPTTNADIIESVTYFDGLGRPKQQIAIKASNDQKDIVTHIEYDDYGRQTKQYLPLKSNTTIGHYRNPSSLKTATKGFYKNKYPEDFVNIPTAEVNPYTEQVLETSPLGRVLKIGASGSNWKAIANSNTDHSIKFDYSSNSVNEVIRFDVSLSSRGIPSLIKNGNYTANTLFKTITKDENWQPTDNNNHTTQEFKDFQGRVILKRTFNEGQPHETYYVYDDFGNLTYVIPPKVNTQNSISITILNDLCYQYKYDDRNRLIEKKIPGKGKESIVYNKLDQPVMTTDPNLRSEKKWLFTKYDVFGRVIYTGIKLYGHVFASVPDAVNYTIESQNIEYESRTNNSQSVGNSMINYTNNTQPSPTEILTANYYDDYLISDIPSHVAPTTVFEQVVATGIQTKGLTTFNKVKVLDQDKWIYTVTYYDLKKRPIYVYNQNNYLNTVDITKTKYDFVGKVLKTRSEHTKENSTTIVTQDVFTYDHMGRLIDQHQCIGDSSLNENCGDLKPSPYEDIETRSAAITSGEDIQANHQVRFTSGFQFVATSSQTLSASIFNQGETGELIIANTYDELGQLERKKVGNSKAQPLQDVDYAYNVRGWLKQINDPSTNLSDDLFAFKINYNTTNISGSTALYNGNISETHWKTKNDNIARNYKYEYDALNRINSAINNSGHFNLSNVDYDKMGNILTLNRKGAINSQGGFAFVEMDRLTYEYSGNQLLKVTDNSNLPAGFRDGANSGDDYSYDVNGNMIKDENKEILNIEYNHLNLPTVVKIGNPSYNSATIYYTYDATGQKQEKKVIGINNNTPKLYNVTQYSGNFRYKQSALFGAFRLEFINHPEGYIEPKNENDPSKGFNYVYQFKDHLGNIRLSYSDANGDGQVAVNEIREEKNYYPFGLTHKGYNSDIRGRKHNYGYNGKEENDELGLEWLDFSARNYDPAIGRWMKVDPLADQRSWVSPYNFVQNNPINRIDPDGALDAPIYGRDGEFLGTDDQGLQGKAIVMDAENFTQGMSHEDALSNSLGAKGLNEGGLEKLSTHKAGLKDRPDYDGELTLGEANDWFNDGNGSPLYVNSAKIDLSPVETSDFGDKSSMYYNFFTDAKGDYTTGRVYGTIKLSLMDENGTVKLGGSSGHLDTYDFDIKENKSNNFKTGLRNFGTRVGKTFAGKGAAYKILTYGSGTVEKTEKSN